MHLSRNQFLTALALINMFFGVVSLSDDKKAIPGDPGNVPPHAKEGREAAPQAKERAVAAPANRQSCDPLDTEEISKLPVFRRLKWKDKTIYVLGEDHHPQKAGINQSIFEDIWDSCDHSSSGYFMESYIKNDPRSFFMYFGGPDYRRYEKKKKIVHPVEDEKSLTAEKLMKVYLLTSQVLESSKDGGRAISETYDLAGAMAGLLKFAAKSDKAYARWKKSAKKNHLLDEKATKEFELLRSLFVLDYRDAWDFNEDTKAGFQRAKEWLLKELEKPESQSAKDLTIYHPYLSKNPKLEFPLISHLMEQPRSFFENLKSSVKEQLESISAEYSSEPERQKLIRDFLEKPTDALRDRVEVSWRTQDMVKNVADDVKQGKLKNYFVRLGASHANEFTSDLKRALGDVKLEKEVIDPAYKEILEKKY